MRLSDLIEILQEYDDTMDVKLRTESMTDIENEWEISEDEDMDPSFMVENGELYIIGRGPINEGT
jgi:hypothetical protein